jgi:cytochrome c oxidase subunit II
MTTANCLLLAIESLGAVTAASTSAQRHDTVFHTLLWVTSFFFILVLVLMLSFIVLYRRRRGAIVSTAEAPTYNTVLEIIWTFVPICVVTVFFVIGLRVFLDADTPPPNAEVIEVEARQWQFTFTYPNGATGNALYLRVNRPVVLKLNSKDVLHALYIPAFRLQRNAIPGRTSEMWIQPTMLGTYYAFCTQYCGDGHSLMTAEVVVLENAAYEAKLAELANIFVDPETQHPLPYAQVGEKIYKTAGCSQCHSVDGSPNTGPTWKGLYKRDVAFSVAPPGYTLKTGDDDAKWEAYLRESVLDPPAKVVEGFQNVMQSYADQFSGTQYKEKKLAAIIAYIKSLGNQPIPPAQAPGLNEPKS